jgi:hypothetical protein
VLKIDNHLRKLSENEQMVLDLNLKKSKAKLDKIVTESNQGIDDKTNKT